jgi:catechol 2,3-dioxygenase-like lactoylglutathione lyase family enzyme
MGFISGVDFVAVPVADYERAKQFYGDVLELEQSKQYGSRPGGEYETGSLTFQIMETEAFGMGPPQPSQNPIALHVDDFEGSKAKLEERGVEFIHGLDSGVCHMAFFKDPDGNTFCLHHRYAPPDARPPGVDAD